MQTQQLTQNKARTITRSNKPADEMSPIVREIAVADFIARPNTERMARQFGSGRLHLTDAILFEVARDVLRIKSRLGMRDGFGRPTVRTMAASASAAA